MPNEFTIEIDADASDSEQAFEDILQDIQRIVQAQDEATKKSIDNVKQGSQEEIAAIRASLAEQNARIRSGEALSEQEVNKAITAARRLHDAKIQLERETSAQTINHIKRTTSAVSDEERSRAQQQIRQINSAATESRRIISQSLEEEVRAARQIQTEKKKLIQEERDEKIKTAKQIIESENRTASELVEQQNRIQKEYEETARKRIALIKSVDASPGETRRRVGSVLSDLGRQRASSGNVIAELRKEAEKRTEIIQKTLDEELRALRRRDTAVDASTRNRISKERSAANELSQSISEEERKKVTQIQNTANERISQARRAAAAEIRQVRNASRTIIGEESRQADRKEESIRNSSKLTRTEASQAIRQARLRANAAIAGIQQETAAKIEALTDEKNINKQELADKKRTAQEKLRQVKDRTKQEERLEKEKVRAIQRINRRIALGARNLAFAFFGLGDLATVARFVFDATLEIERLREALEALYGSAELANQEFDDLLDLARQPGISLTGAADAVIKLKAIGIEGQKAHDIVRELGNALALTAQPESSNRLLIRAIAQIEGRGKVQQEEINQLIEPAPILGQALRRAFGSQNAEQIREVTTDVEDFREKFVAELRKLERAPVDSLQNTLDNFGIEIKRLAASFGDLVEPGVRKGLKTLTDLFRETATAINKASEETNIWIRRFNPDIWESIAITVGAALKRIFSDFVQLGQNINSAYKAWNLFLNNLLTGGEAGRKNAIIEIAKQSEQAALLIIKNNSEIAKAFEQSGEKTRKALDELAEYDRQQLNIDERDILAETAANNVAARARNLKDRINELSTVINNLGTSRINLQDLESALAKVSSQGDLSDRILKQVREAEKLARDVSAASGEEFTVPSVSVEPQARSVLQSLITELEDLERLRGNFDIPGFTLKILDLDTSRSNLAEAENIYQRIAALQSGSFEQEERANRDVLREYQEIKQIEFELFALTEDNKDKRAQKSAELRKELQSEFEELLKRDGSAETQRLADLLLNRRFTAPPPRISIIDLTRARAEANAADRLFDSILKSETSTIASIIAARDDLATKRKLEADLEYRLYAQNESDKEERQAAGIEIQDKSRKELESIHKKSQDRINEITKEGARQRQFIFFQGVEDRLRVQEITGIQDLFAPISEQIRGLSSDSASKGSVFEQLSREARLFFDSLDDEQFRSFEKNLQELFTDSTTPLSTLTLEIGKLLTEFNVGASDVERFTDRISDLTEEIQRNRRAAVDAQRGFQEYADALQFRQTDFGNLVFQNLPDDDNAIQFSGERTQGATSAILEYIDAIRSIPSRAASLDEVSTKLAGIEESTKESSSGITAITGNILRFFEAIPDRKEIVVDSTESEVNLERLGKLIERFNKEPLNIQIEGSSEVLEQHAEQIDALILQLTTLPAAKIGIESSEIDSAVARLRILAEQIGVAIEHSKSLQQTEIEVQAQQTVAPVAETQPAQPTDASVTAPSVEAPKIAAPEVEAPAVTPSVDTSEAIAQIQQLTESLEFLNSVEVSSELNIDVASLDLAAEKLNELTATVSNESLSAQIELVPDALEGSAEQIANLISQIESLPESEIDIESEQIDIALDKLRSLASQIDSVVESARSKQIEAPDIEPTTTTAPQVTPLNVPRVGETPAIVASTNTTEALVQLEQLTDALSIFNTAADSSELNIDISSLDVIAERLNELTATISDESFDLKLEDPKSVFSGYTDEINSIVEQLSALPAGAVNIDFEEVDAAILKLQVLIGQINTATEYSDTLKLSPIAGPLPDALKIDEIIELDNITAAVSQIKNLSEALSNFNQEAADTQKVALLDAATEQLNEILNLFNNQTLNIQIEQTSRGDFSEELRDQITSDFTARINTIIEQLRSIPKAEIDIQTESIDIAISKLEQLAAQAVGIAEAAPVSISPQVSVSPQAPVQVPVQEPAPTQASAQTPAPTPQVAPQATPVKDEVIDTSSITEAIINLQSLSDELDKYKINRDRLIASLKDEEGLSLNRYKDSEGVDTIGYGINVSGALPQNILDYLEVDDSSEIQTVTQEQAQRLFEEFVQIALKDARAVFGESFDSLSALRQEILVNLSFNLGKNTLSDFDKLINAVRDEDFDTGSKEILDSDAGRLLVNRYTRLSEAFRTDDPSFLNLKDGDAYLSTLDKIIAQLQRVSEAEKGASGLDLGSLASSFLGISRDVAGTVDGIFTGVDEAGNSLERFLQVVKNVSAAVGNAFSSASESISESTSNINTNADAIAEIRAQLTELSTAQTQIVGFDVDSEAIDRITQRISEITDAITAAGVERGLSPVEAFAEAARSSDPVLASYAEALRETRRELDLLFQQVTILSTVRNITSLDDLTDEERSRLDELIKTISRGQARTQEAIRSFTALQAARASFANLIREDMLKNLENIKEVEALFESELRDLGDDPLSKLVEALRQTFRQTAFNLKPEAGEIESQLKSIVDVAKLFQKEIENIDKEIAREGILKLTDEELRNINSETVRGDILNLQQGFVAGELDKPEVQERLIFLRESYKAANDLRKQDEKDQIDSARRTHSVISNLTTSLTDSVLETALNRDKSFKDVAEAFIKQSIRIISRSIIDFNLQKALDDRLTAIKLANLAKLAAAREAARAANLAAETVTGGASAALSVVSLTSGLSSVASTIAALFHNEQNDLYARTAGVDIRRSLTAESPVARRNARDFTNNIVRGFRQADRSGTGQPQDGQGSPNLTVINQIKIGPNDAREIADYLADLTGEGRL